MPNKKDRDFLRRWEGNPIITLEDIPFRCNTVFNGSPVKIDGKYLLLLRVEGLWPEVKMVITSKWMKNRS